MVGTISVFPAPWSTVFTRTPNRPSSSAATLEMPRTAYLVAL